MRNFQILIVSAVKICKQCLQTASASWGLYPHPLPGLCPQLMLMMLFMGCCRVGQRAIDNSRIWLVCQACSAFGLINDWFMYLIFLACTVEIDDIRHLTAVMCFGLLTYCRTCRQKWCDSDRVICGVFCSLVE